MPEFQLIKRQDVPNAWQIGKMGPRSPKARLHSSGTILFSVLAAAVLGDRDCKVLIEFDEAARTLKFTVADKLPRGVSEADTFPLRIRCTGPANRRPIGMISLKALFNYIGFKWSGVPAVDLDITAIDAAARSITLVLPGAYFVPAAPQ